MDFKSFKKLETLPPSRMAQAASDDERLLVLLKLHEGEALPSYVSPRAKMGPTIFSAEIDAHDLARIEADPAIESVSVSQRLPLIK